MKPTAYLINTSRGALVDEDASPRALEERGSPVLRSTFCARSRRRRITRCSLSTT